jgi:LAO/AO transport system kinase
LKTRLTFDEFYTGIQKGDNFVLAQAITLTESTLPQDQELADQLLGGILPFTGNSVRIGITGVPGVGKSTFIEALGNHITSLGKKIAVLTIDPSSQVTKGSILGDKTRMPELSKNELAFVRPSSSGAAIGGVTQSTREAILFCEAAGFEVILVETVGVGQSEAAVKNMVDFFLLLMLPGAGDELQGLKKGIIEMADMLIITKADGENISRAKIAQAEYQQALHLLPPSSNEWKVSVSTCSALTNVGIDAAWTAINDFFRTVADSGLLQRNREEQNIQWMHEYFNDLLLADILNKGNLDKTVATLEKKIRKKEIPAKTAARLLFKTYRDASGKVKS